MLDRRTDDICALFGHVDQVATRPRRKFNSIYDALLKDKKKDKNGCISGNEQDRALREDVRGPRYLQHG